MKCLVCGSENDVKNLGNIYTIGSEGTDLCFNCRVLVGNLIATLMRLKTNILFNYTKDKKGR